MSILSNDALEAAARATMVTNAIAWIINNIPSAMLPLPLLAAVTLLKAVVPFLGYIGKPSCLDSPLGLCSYSLGARY